MGTKQIKQVEPKEYKFQCKYGFKTKCRISSIRNSENTIYESLDKLTTPILRPKIPRNNVHDFKFIPYEGFHYEKNVTLN